MAILVGALNRSISMRSHFSSLLPSFASLLSFSVSFVNHQFKAEPFRQVHRLMRTISSSLTLAISRACFKKRWISRKYVFLAVCSIGEAPEDIDLSSYIGWKNPILSGFHLECPELVPSSPLFSGGPCCSGYPEEPICGGLSWTYWATAAVAAIAMTV